MTQPVRFKGKKGKKPRKPQPEWLKAIIRFFIAAIFLGLAGLILLIGWTIYTEIYEANLNSAITYQVPFKYT